MAECPPGVHSMFDFCPGDCTEPVEDVVRHLVDGVLYLCYPDDHHCPSASRPPKE